MYRTISAAQYKDHLGLSSDYQVDGVLCYGTLYEDRMIKALEDSLQEAGVTYQLNNLPHPSAAVFVMSVAIISQVHPADSLL